MTRLSASPLRRFLSDWLLISLGLFMENHGLLLRPTEWYEVFGLKTAPCMLYTSGYMHDEVREFESVYIRARAMQQNGR